MTGNTYFNFNTRSKINYTFNWLIILQEISLKDFKKKTDGFNLSTESYNIIFF